jgi:hypothetical protein
MSWAQYIHPFRPEIPAGGRIEFERDRLQGYAHSREAELGFLRVCYSIKVA